MNKLAILLILLPTIATAGELGISLNSTTGNVETETVGVSGKTEHKSERLTLKLNGEYTSTKTKGQRVRFWTVESKLRADIGEGFVSLLARHEGNRPAGLNSRWTIGGSWGREHENGSHKLLGEIGPTLILENRINSENQEFISARAFGEYSYTISKSAKFLQNAEYLYDLADRQNYRLNTRSELEVQVTEDVSLRMSLQMKYVNLPPAGRRQTDVYSGTSLVVKF